MKINLKTEVMYSNNGLTEHVGAQTIFLALAGLLYSLGN